MGRDRNELGHLGERMDKLAEFHRADKVDEGMA